MANNNTNPDDGLLNPGEIIKPDLSKCNVPELVNKLFGLDVFSFKELKSYDDINYLLKVSSNFSNDNIVEISTNGYVLKVMNSLDSKDLNTVHGQNKMMLFLKGQGFKVPTPVLNLDGRYISFQVFNKYGKSNVVRLLNFVPGKMLFDVPYTAGLYYETGEWVAKLDNALQNFRHDGLEDRNFMWMMSSVPELTKFTYVIKDVKRHKIVTEVLQAWDANVVPLMPSFKRGIVHGDINEQNIVVKQDDANPDVYHVDGLIDFGDISVSCYIFEIAIAVTYMTLENKCMPHSEVGGHVLAGYLKHRGLSEDEWMVFKNCISARLVQSLVMGAYSYEQNPGNEYLLTTAANGWKILEEFWAISNNELIAKWKEIIQTY